MNKVNRPWILLIIVVNLTVNGLPSVSPEPQLDVHLNENEKDADLGGRQRILPPYMSWRVMRNPDCISCNSTDDCGEFMICEKDTRICCCPSERPVYINGTVDKCHIVVQLQEPCNYTEQCSVSFNECRNGKCKCRADNVICKNIGALGDYCTHDNQCRSGECFYAPCFCSLSSMRCEKGSESSYAIGIAITCTILFVVVVIFSLFYRRYAKLNQNNTTDAHPNRQNSVEIRFQTPIDIPPPLYEEVVMQPQKLDPDLPSYEDYVELQKLHFQNSQKETFKSDASSINPALQKD